MLRVFDTRPIDESSRWYQNLLAVVNKSVFVNESALFWHIGGNNHNEGRFRENHGYFSRGYGFDSQRNKYAR